MAAPLINFSGLASGIDTNSLISATSDAARTQKEKPLQDKVTELQTTDDALTELKNRLTSLKTILYNFSTANGGNLSKQASSGDETVLTATAASNASNGSYNITVSALAQNATQSFGKVAKYATATDLIDSTVVGTKTVTITTGTSPGEAITVDVTNATTLSDFVTTFNGESTKALASVVNVGSTANPDYRIIVTSNSTGVTNGKIVVDLGGLTAFNNNSLSQATDASLSMSGIAGSISRPTNTITDLIPGITFNLKGLGGPTAISVGDDIAGSTTNVQAFVDAYNQVVQYINENNTITRQEDTTTNDVSNIFGSLAKTTLDNDALSSVRSNLASASYRQIGPDGNNTNSIAILADLGITTNKDPYDTTTQIGGGTLDFDTTVFAAAMAKEPDSVNRILTSLADAAATTNGTIAQYVQFNGLFDTSVNNDKTEISDLNDRIAQAEADILKNEDDMRARFAKLESTMSDLQSQQKSLTAALGSLGTTSG